MKANFSAVITGLILTLMTLSGCASSGENAQQSGANAQQFASVLSTRVDTYQYARSAMSDLGWNGDPFSGQMYSLSDLLRSYAYRDLVAVCKFALDDLNAIGEPDAEIAPLVQETKDAFAKCQTQGPATDYFDFSETYLADATNVWDRWIPYGVPEIDWSE